LSKTSQPQAEQSQSSPNPQPSQEARPPATPSRAYAGFAVASQSAATPADAQRPDRILRSGHAGTVDALTFSPDGRWLASGSSDRTIRVWDLSTGRTICTLEGHTDDVWSLSFSPDGKHLASASQDGAVRIWDAGSGETLYSLNSRSIPVAAIFTGDGQFLIVHRQSKDGEDLSVDIRNAANSELISTIAPDWSMGRLLGPTSTGSLLSSGGRGEDGDVDVATKVWDLKTGKELKSFPISTQAVSFDGRQLASYKFQREGGKITLYDANSGKILRTIIAPDPYVGHLAFAPDGSRLVAAIGNGSVSGTGSTIQVWDTVTGKELETLPGEKNSDLHALTISPDSKLLAAGSYSGNAIRIWDLATAQVVHTLQGNPYSGNLAFNQQGELLMCEPNGLQVWNVADGKEVRHISGVAGGPIAVSSDGDWAASSPQGSPKLWNAKSWTSVNLSPPPGSQIWFLAFAERPLGPPLANSGIKSWQISGGAHGSALLGSTYAMAVSPDKKLLALGHERGGDVEVWDLTNSTKVTALAATQVSINRLEFSPDGKLLLTAGQETRITPAMLAAHQLTFENSGKLWDVVTWKILSSFTFSGIGVGVGTFSPDSRLLVFNRPGVIEFLDINNGKVVRRLASGQFSGNALFSPDGAWLADVTQGGVYVWKLDSKEVVKAGAN
jgi:WD40 repeat protein